MAKVKLTPVDHDPFVPPLAPEADNPQLGSLLLRIGGGIGEGLLKAAMAPGEAYQSTTPVTTDEMIAPAASMAGMVTLGAGAVPAEADALRAGMGYKLTPVDHDPFAAHEMDIPGTAKKLAKMASEMGYSVGHDASNVSRSQYLTLDHPSLDSSLKIRIADHSLPPSYPNSANIEVGPHGEAVGWANAISALARRIGAPVPGEAASQLAQDEAERIAQEKLTQERSAAYQANQRARAKALENIQNSPNAARVAELQKRLNDPSITGNARKKLNAKLREALGYKFDPNR